jgi:aldehyde dehydrogenase (NAD+)
MRGIFFNTFSFSFMSAHSFFCFPSIQESVYDEFVEKTVAATAKRTLGDPFTDVDQGPQQNLRQFEKIKRLLKSGKEEGATVLHGGNIIGDCGYFVEPTVFGDVKDEMQIAREEIFGPCMQILKFSDTADAIRRANASDYGLAGAVFSQNIDTCMSVSRAIRAGSVWINAYHVFDASLPFGGYKHSGFGRIKSEYALENFTNVKCIATPLKDDGGWY